MNEIVCKKRLVSNIYEFVLNHKYIARKALPGQFVIIRTDEKGDRAPFTICDTDPEKGTVTLVVMEVGRTSRKFIKMSEGDVLSTLVGPLGKPAEIAEKEKVLCIGGCYGIGGIYYYAKFLKEKDNYVITLLEGKEYNLLYWQDKIHSKSDELYAVTREGRNGFKGHIPDGVNKIFQKHPDISRVYSIGCTFMMMIVSLSTKTFSAKTYVNLNPIMIDGTGMCGSCRVSVAGKTKFACIDGPDFDGHEIDWDNLLLRRKAYLKNELLSLRNELQREDY